MDKTSLGDRMKQYEAVPKNFLLRRTPVIIRLEYFLHYGLCRIYS